MSSRKDPHKIAVDGGACADLAPCVQRFVHRVDPRIVDSPHHHHYSRLTEGQSIRNPDTIHIIFNIASYRVLDPGRRLSFLFCLSHTPRLRSEYTPRSDKWLIRWRRKRRGRLRVPRAYTAPGIPAQDSLSFPMQCYGSRRAPE